MEWLESLVLGIVQGLTEFLPVSSDGHLTLTNMVFAMLTGRSRSGAENLFFDVMLHLGTLAAIALHYRAVVGTGARGLLGSSEVPPPYRRDAVVRTGVLMVVATLPLIPYAFFKKYLNATFESLTVVGLGFLTTATVLLLSSRLRGGEKGPAETTWRDALLIGIAQTFAPLPGVSRSGMTVATALGLGLSRSWSVGFSLLIAFPAIMGATVMELKDLDSASLTSDRVAQTVVATLIAGVIGYMAIIWLVKIVRAGRMWYFSVYLYVLALSILASQNLAGGTSNAAGSKAPDRTSRLGPAGTGVGSGGERARGNLDRSHAVGTRPAPSRAGSAAALPARHPNLLLGRALAGDSIGTEARPRLADAGGRSNRTE